MSPINIGMYPTYSTSLGYTFGIIRHDYNMHYKKLATPTAPSRTVTIPMGDAASAWGRAPPLSPRAPGIGDRGDGGPEPLELHCTV